MAKHHRKPPSLFGQRLRFVRQARGLTQAELAERVGISTQAMHSLEMGDTPSPRLPHLKVLAEQLEVSLDFLVGVECAKPWAPLPVLQEPAMA